MRFSSFRKNLLVVCKSCFEQFFDEEERNKAAADFEKSLKF